MSRASGLHRLQAMDLAADQLRHRQHEIEARLSDSAELDRLRSGLAAASEAAQAAAAVVRSAHRVVQDQRHKLKEAEQALYGGRVHSPKELTELQAEVESLKRHLDTLEDRYLEAMLSQDPAAATERQSQLAVELLMSDRSSQHAELQAELGQIRDRLADFELEREAALVSVSADDRATYDRLRARLGGVAVALLEEASCGACGLRVSASTEQLVRGGAVLITCGQCGRVLYGG
ncbi:MAG: zinc ribbon domain-containing protein [Anaerolineales bacterium]